MRKFDFWVKLIPKMRLIYQNVMRTWAVNWLRETWQEKVMYQLTVIIVSIK